MNDLLIQKMEIQTISNDEILEFSKEAKQYYEENKKDLYEAKKELYDMKAIHNKANMKYQKNNRPRFNEYHRNLREKNKDNFFCHFCDHGYSDAPHYKIHCQSLKHQTNMKKAIEK